MTVIETDGKTILAMPVVGVLCWPAYRATRRVSRFLNAVRIKKANA